MAVKSSSLLDRIKLPITTLNKKLIIGILCLVLVFIVWIMIDALSAPAANFTPNSGSKITATPGGVSAPPAALGQLPTTYGDASQINTLLNRNVDGLSPEAAKKLNLLQSAEQDLQHQLAVLSTRPAANAQQAFSTEAASSSIFFAGGAPPLQNTPNASVASNMGATKPGTPTPVSGSYNAFAQQNGQAQKLDFLTSKPSKQIYNNNTVQYPASPYILQAGSVIPGSLITTIVTNLPGVITATVESNVYDSITGQYLLIPKGSKLIGDYNSSVTFGQNQVQVKFTRLIRPDGSSIVLPNEPGVNKLGTSGLADDVNNHWGRIIGSAALSALFNLPAVVASSQQNNNSTVCNGGTCVTGNSTGDVMKTAALASAGAAASQVGSQLAQQSLNIQPEITIHSGFQFSIMVTKDIILPPYPESGPDNAAHP